jgi:hypothetical protein
MERCEYCEKIIKPKSKYCHQKSKYCLNIRYNDNNITFYHKKQVKIIEELYKEKRQCKAKKRDDEICKIKYSFPNGYCSAHQYRDLWLLTENNQIYCIGDLWIQPPTYITVDIINKNPIEKHNYFNTITYKLKQQEKKEYSQNILNIFLLKEVSLLCLDYIYDKDVLDTNILKNVIGNLNQPEIITGIKKHNDAGYGITTSHMTESYGIQSDKYIMEYFDNIPHERLLITLKII